jgi:glucose/mannose transport system permease protein
MAARIDGIPRWRVYASIVLPMLKTVVRHRVRAAVGERGEGVRRRRRDDAGRPGHASEVPAKFIIDNLLVRANIGLASAASTVLLLTVLALLAPWFYARAHASCAERARACAKGAQDE